MIDNQNILAFCMVITRAISAQNGIILPNNDQFCKPLYKITVSAGYTFSHGTFRLFFYIENKNAE